jgi:hypothetical protein
MKRWALLTAIIVLLLTTPAIAAIVNFRDYALFGGADGHGNFTSGPTGLGTLTLSATSQGSATLEWDASFGFGVNWPSNNNTGYLEQPEKLLITFASPIYLSSITLSGLSTNEGGYYQLNGSGSLFGFTGTSNVGSLTLALDLHTPIRSILFSGASPGNRNSYAVTELNGTVVPIPAAAWLLGSGVVGLALLRRRVPR